MWILSRSSYSLSARFDPSKSVLHVLLVRTPIAFACGVLGRELPTPSGLLLVSPATHFRLHGTQRVKGLLEVLKSDL